MGVSTPMGKTGNAEVQKIGHTYSGKFGVDPLATGAHGNTNQPTEQSWK